MVSLAWASRPSTQRSGASRRTARTGMLHRRHPHQRPSLPSHSRRGSTRRRAGTSLTRPSRSPSRPRLPRQSARTVRASRLPSALAPSPTAPSAQAPTVPAPSAPALMVALAGRAHSRQFRSAASYSLPGTRARRPSRNSASGRRRKPSSAGRGARLSTSSRSPPRRSAAQALRLAPTRLAAAALGPLVMPALGRLAVPCGLCIPH
jgi:hypothetical protein